MIFHQDFHGILSELREIIDNFQKSQHLKLHFQKFAKSKQNLLKFCKFRQEILVVAATTKATTKVVLTSATLGHPRWETLFGKPPPFALAAERSASPELKAMAAALREASRVRSQLPSCCSRSIKASSSRRAEPKLVANWGCHWAGLQLSASRCRPLAVGPALTVWYFFLLLLHFGKIPKKFG